MKLPYFIAAALVSFSVSAQDHICGTDIFHNQYIMSHPEIAAKIAQSDELLAQHGEYINREIQDNQVYEIPIVVHVLHTGDAIGTFYNPSDAAIQSWLDYTNAIFAATAPGYTSSAVIPIKYVLAKRDPQCNATNGIVRVNASVVPQYAMHGMMLDSPNGAPYQDLLALSRWDPHFYYNVYVVTQLGTSQGIASLPPSSTDIDGMFLIAAAISNNSIGAHEFGHSLGLIHVFGTSTGTACPPNQNCLLDNDMVCDTAPVARVINGVFPTNNVINPCSGVNYNNEQSNIMGYSSVKNNFTQGQSNRAIAKLLQHRQNLLTSNAELPPAGNTVSIANNCIPQGTAFEEGFEMGPVKVVFGNINNPSDPRIGNTASYIDYIQMGCLSPALSTSIPANTPTTLQVEILSNNQRVAAYIDYDNNGVFDTSTELALHVNQNSYTTGTYTITPPASCVKNVPLRMRIIATAGVFFVEPCVTPEYGQAEDYAVTILESLSTHDVDKLNISLFPNPVTNILNVTCDTQINSLEVMDLNGRTVIFSKHNKSDALLDLTELSTGIYIVKVMSDAGTLTKKVVKQ